MRAGLIKNALLVLKNHPVTSGYDASSLSDHNINFMNDLLSGEGKKQDRSAWYFKRGGDPPTPQEIRLIVKTYLKSLKCSSIPSVTYLLRTR